MNTTAIGGYNAMMSMSTSAGSVKTDKTNSSTLRKTVTMKTDSFQYSSAVNGNDKSGIYSSSESLSGFSQEITFIEETTIIRDEGEGDPDKLYTYDTETVNKLLEESNRKIQEFRDLLRKILGGQADTENKKIFGNSYESKFPVDENGMVDLSGIEGVKEFEFDEEYWGAEATAQRIFDMAKAFAGEDSYLLELMKQSVQVGFSEVETIFGGKGKLPQVSYDTLDRFNQLFDEYTSGLSGKTEASEKSEE